VSHTTQKSNKNAYDKIEVNMNEKMILDFLYRWMRPIRAGDLKKELEIKHTTLNSQLEILEKKKLIEWKRYGTISLTEQGTEYAAHLARHHRLLESFFVETLSMSVNDAHEISSQLTPVVSCKLIIYIIEKLGEKEKCPCGFNIPKTSSECYIGGLE